MKLTQKELLLIKWATTDVGLQGIFDYENLTNHEFKRTYGLGKNETDAIAISIRNKVLKEQEKLSSHLAKLKSISAIT